MKFNFLPAAAFLLMAGVSAAHAQTFTPLLTATVGTGSEETFLALDFKDGTPNDNFAFGYKYDGTKTGADLLNALASSGLTTQYIFNGAAVNGFTFGSHSEAGFTNTSYWEYWKSTDGQNWSYSSVGVAAPLTAGGWDGWSFTTTGDEVPPVTPTTSMPAAVPEASSAVSLGLLALLGAGLTAVRRKKTA